jgi:hypothetical protein
MRKYVLMTGSQWNEDYSTEINELREVLQADENIRIHLSCKDMILASTEAGYSVITSYLSVHDVFESVFLIDPYEGTVKSTTEHTCASCDHANNDEVCMLKDCTKEIKLDTFTHMLRYFNTGLRNEKCNYFVNKRGARSSII